MAISGMGVAYTVGGFVLLYSGWANRGIKDTLTGLLKGTAPTPNPQPLTIGVSNNQQGNVAAGTPVVQGTQGQAGGTAGQNQALAKLLAAATHPTWVTGQEWTDWVALWNRESGWSNTAENSSSGAYGIPQALPASKMPKSAQPPKDGGSSNAAAQISWGIAYIAERYGSPSAAWAHETSAGWY